VYHLLRSIPHKKAVPSILLAFAGERNGREGGMHGDLVIEAAKVVHPGNCPKAWDPSKDG